MVTSQPPGRLSIVRSTNESGIDDDPLRAEKQLFVKHFSELMDGKRDVYYLLVMCAQNGEPFGSEELFSGLEDDRRYLNKIKVSLFRRITESRFRNCLSTAEPAGQFKRYTWEGHGFPAEATDKLATHLLDPRHTAVKQFNYLGGQVPADVVLREGKEHRLPVPVYEPGSYDTSFMQDALCAQIYPDLFTSTDRKEINLGNVICGHCVVAESCGYYQIDIKQ